MSVKRLYHRRGKRKRSSYIFQQEDINNVIFKLPPMSKVIGEFVPLRKSGKDFVGRCPLCKQITQNDKHFRVSDKKGLYKCFECGAGGNSSTSFLVRYFDSTFGDVLIFLNNKYTKISLPREIRRMKGPNIDEDLPF